MVIVMSDWLEVIGVSGLIVIGLFLVLLPLICTIVLGTYIATMLGLTGLVWWCFVILFWMILSGFMAMINRIGA
jgi:hypothetical protein